MSEHMMPIPSMIYNASVGGHVTNSQQIIDENLNREQQDINEEVAAVPYNATTPNGMGKIVLKKNDNFKQVVEAQTYGNTIFVIKYDFTLTGNVDIPANCVLEFDGGSIRAGSGANMDTITGNNTGINAGLVKIFDTNVTFAGSWNILEIYPEWFGAVLSPILPIDSRVFSTDAFKAANKFINSVDNIEIVIKLSSVSQSLNDSPNFYSYLLAGNNIFGNTNSESIREKVYHIGSVGATMCWYPETENDILFNFDEVYSKIILENFDVLTYDDIDSFSTKGTIFNIKSISTDANGGSIYRNVRIIGTTNKIKYVFKVTGNAQCDKTLVQRCDFAQFLYGFYCDNQEAVCWNFDNSSFHASYHDSIVFDILDIQDSLNVTNCSFGLCNGNIFIRSRDNLGNHTPEFNYNFINNRIEVYTNDFREVASQDDIVIECSNNKINISNCFFRGAGSSSKLRLISKDSGKITIENCELRTIIACSGLLNSNYKGTSILIENSYIPNISYKAVDAQGTLLDIMSDNTYCSILPIELINCTIGGETYQRPWDFELVSDGTDYNNGYSRPAKVHVVSYYRNAWDEEPHYYSIPKYQIIKEINAYVFNNGLATDAITARVSFGDNTHYIEKTIQDPNNFIGKINLFSGIVFFNPDTIIPQIKVEHTNNVHPAVKTYGMLIEVVYQAAPLITLRETTVVNNQDVVIIQTPN